MRSQPVEQAMPKTAPVGAARLLHSALDRDGDATPLAQSHLTDQLRLSIVLQAAGLLAHLEHAGWYLPLGWHEAQVDAAGRLRVGSVRSGHAVELPQRQLLGLVEVLFRGHRVAGRGTARRALRQLLGRWRQQLVARAADRCVGEILDAAPFLWSVPLRAGVEALVGEHDDGQRRHLWVAGPGRNRRRVLAVCRDRAAAEDLIENGLFQGCWEGCGERGHEVDPEALVAAGRVREAVDVWTCQPPAGAPGRIAYAGALLHVGRATRALDVLDKLRRPEARVLRLHCTAALGEMGATQEALRRLASARLPASLTVEAAEVAVRLLANRNASSAAAEDWLGRAHGRARGLWKLRACILSALAAWDGGDHSRMMTWLERAEGAREEPTLAWRWHKARASACQLMRDGDGMVVHLRAALGTSRRRLPVADAARLWNDLAVGRALASDLTGAERACRHAVRLFEACDGPVPLTLALTNLAEVRLRRGRFEGVEAIIESSAQANRRAGNVRGLRGDLELWARLELARGRLDQALERCDAAAASAPGVAPENDLVPVLRARALGWQRQGEAAGQLLGASAPVAVADLEPEERPALFALAGRLDLAASQARGTPWAVLWQRLARGEPPPADAWAALDRLEPFRAARLMLDCELFRAGSVPPRRLRRAVAVLRQAGAEPLARRLESRVAGPWLAIERFLERPAEELSPTIVGSLLEDAGFGDTRLAWRGREGRSRRVLVAGPGGEERLSIPGDGGRWELATPQADPVQRSLLALIARLVPPPTEDRPEQVTTTTLIGDSPLLRAAVDRLTRLAASELPILLLGESGTGKELAAREAHRTSPRAQGAFLPINCAALSETLLLADLFGHVRGAFTGAERERKGVFEEASGGTVFLDEIGDLPLSAQGALLRVLQEGEIRRQGESRPRPVNVRVIAATHRDLDSMVVENTFRQDLYFRLKVASVQLPPLRARDGDVMLLAEHLLGTFSDGPPIHIAEDARSALMRHRWPGNVRELRNVLDVARTLAADGVVRREHLDLPELPEPNGQGTYHQRLEAFRRELIEQALLACEGKQAEAARQLGVSRQALSYMVRQLGIH